ncbi:diguanylate cyclase/phosphodiesterase (GGDEF & EAL domains) with PAS/PAC sensor(s) [hydrothermal vent metagenome]|uniref:Diguanylate cyclase/phosphodiesterase (GGDEF & EAL domains) with PAS/PAC sensor(S) n=1 Tax=hydrothermal vent metagenome TaxID=652676 RepID=A0A3B0Z2P5_9ZZZZ
MDHSYLMAEDNPADIELVTEMMNQAYCRQYSLVCVDRYALIDYKLSTETFQALILDLNLPDHSGVENINILSQQYPQLPIIILTGLDDQTLAIEALKNGVQDYLNKDSLTPELLSRSLRYAQERKRIEVQLKQALEDAATRNTQLEALAQYDFMTSLPNRAYFQHAANQLLSRALRCGKWLALLYLDLNSFKKVNDNYGHAVGDDLLRQVATRLKKSMRETEFLARMGGDEFVIVTDVLDEKQAVYTLVNRLLSVFELPFTIGDHKILCSSSIGVSFYPDAETLDILMRQGDCAMYEAKTNCNTPVCFYTKQMEHLYTRNIEIESRLSNAIETEQFDTHFQAVFSINHPDELHVEALIRWYSPEQGYISPDEFIPLAESSPMINELTRVVIKHCSQLFTLCEKLNRPSDKISINVCASQLASAPFCSQLIAWLDEYQILPEKICLELTERQMVKNTRQCYEQIQRLRSLGIQIALDDYGTGYSSVTHLLELPLDYLKLDRILIDHIDENPRNQALTAGIIEMAHRLDMKVIAEGIEREEEFNISKELGCDYTQGYFVAKPMPIKAFACSHLDNYNPSQQTEHQGTVF